VSVHTQMVRRAKLGLAPSTRAARRTTGRVTPLVHGNLFGSLDPCELLTGPARTACQFARGILDPEEECEPGFILVNGRCEQGRSRLPDVDPHFLSPAEASISVGEAVMGRYGAGMVPGNQVINRADCNLGGRIRGMVLGNDGVCYNRREISNKERMWPRGRRPLLTGGDLNAISKAKRAAGRLARVISDTRSIGLLKPAPKKRRHK